MMVLKKDPSTTASPLSPENYLPSFPLDSLVTMKPEMVIANIKSANVMKTPENPKANTLRAMAQSVTGSSSIKNDMILLKASDNYNGQGKYLLNFSQISCHRGSIPPHAAHRQ
jgi:hypothetical protein